MTLLRILFFGRIGSTKLVLPKWQNIDILNRDSRVGILYEKRFWTKFRISGHSDTQHCTRSGVFNLSLVRFIERLSLAKIETVGQ